MTFMIPDGLQKLGRTESGRAWIREIPRQLTELSLKWGLVVGKPYASGTVSYVAPARRGDDDVVLKIQLPHDECRYEVDALRIWNGSGAVRVLEHDPVEHALLLEHCDPGGSLGNSSLTDRLAPVIVLLENLWVEVRDPFQTLEDEAFIWRHKLYEEWAIAGCPIEKCLVDLAAKYIDELAGTQGDQVLLHQDLHADNILAAKREPWLAIDPKPLIGEREFAVAPLIRSFELGHSRGEVVGRLDRLSKELHLNRERARKWTIVQTVAWNVDGVSFTQHLDAIRWLAEDSIC